MPNYKKITGNYRDVVDAVGLPEGYYTLQEKEKKLSSVGRKEFYDEELEKDSRRTSYASYLFSVDEMKAKIQDTSALYDNDSGKLIDDSKPLVFAQGMFDGAIFTESFIKHNPAYHTHALADNTFDFFKSLRTVYIDDKGRNSAFALAYLRDNSDLAIPVEERKRFLSIAIIKNTNAALEDREVTFYIDDSFKYSGRKSLATLKTISDSNLFNDIAATLNSKIFEQNIEEIFHNNIFSPVKFNQLLLRLPSNRNIDNCDIKKEHLHQFLAFSRDNFPADHLLHAVLNKIKNDSETKVNFFEEKKFTFLIDQISELINTYSPNDTVTRKNKLLIFAIKIENLGDQWLTSGHNQENNYCMKAAQILRDALAKPDDDVLANKASKIIAKYNEGLLAIQQMKNEQPPLVLDPVPAKPKAPQQLGQNFIRRNLGTALLWSASVVALLGTIALLAGALAPLGVIVAGTAGLIGATLAAVGAGTLALTAASRIVANEKKFGKEVDSFKTKSDKRRAILYKNYTATEQYDKCIEIKTQPIKKDIANQLNDLTILFDSQDNAELDALDQSIIDDIEIDYEPKLEIVEIIDSNNVEERLSSALEQSRNDLDMSHNVHIKDGLAPAPASAKNKSLSSDDKISSPSVGILKQ